MAADLEATMWVRTLVVIVGDTDVARRDELVIVLNWFDELERLVPTEN